MADEGPCRIGPFSSTVLALSQLTCTAGSITASLLAINSVNPLASVMIGWAVFDEKFRVGLAAVATWVGTG